MMDATEPGAEASGSASTPGVLRRLADTFSPLDAWRAMFAAAPVATALRDIDDAHVIVNNAYLDLFGYAESELRDVDLMDLTHPDDRIESTRVMAMLRAGELDKVAGEKRYVRKDGSVFIGRVTASTLADVTGAAQAVLVTIEDVTERLEAQRALEVRESWFRALVQHAADGIVVVDADARLLYASPSALQLVGMSGADLVGSDVLGFVHPDDHAIVAQAFDAGAVTPGVAEALRMRLTRQDGSTRHVEVVTTNLLDDPAVRGIVINLRDLTDAEQVRTVLSIAEARFRRMIENISDTITLLDGQAHVILSTGNLRSIMGYPTDFWTNRNVFDVVHPDDVDGLRGSFLELLATPGQQLSGEVRARLANGQWIDAEIDAVNLLEDAEVQAIVVTTRNITERKKADRELAEARDQAVKSLRIRTEFIASVSHELRTPIHGILGLSELLASADLDDDARGLVLSIGRATESLRMVLDDILDFSKIEVGRLDVNIGPVNALELAEDLTSLFGPQARAKGITLSREIGPGIPRWIMGDALRIRQVLNNLVGNAVKFTAEGEVRVHAERVDPEVEGGPTFVRVTVSDTGIGIPPGVEDELFEPFSQVHGPTTREFGGTGLGLSIAKQLVELMGGELGYSSELGGGSRFWFTLPLVAADPKSISPADAIEAPRRPDQAGTILVVEDNPINQLLVQRQLDRLGYTSRVVDTGIAAIEQFPAEDVDLILMDWQLPVIDGLETTRRWRELERAEGRRRRRPIVAMTASALPGDRERCLAAGMDDFVAKPVSMATLGGIVGRWFTAPDDRSGRPPEWPTSAMAVDPTVLDQLVDELTDPGLVSTVVRTYLRELRPRIDSIRHALDTDDRSQLILTTHTLRSTSTAVGALDLAARCAELERIGRSDGELPPPDHRDDLGSLADAVRAALEHEMKRLGVSA